MPVDANECAGVELHEEPLRRGACAVTVEPGIVETIGHGGADVLSDARVSHARRAQQVVADVRQHHALVRLEHDLSVLRRAPRDGLPLANPLEDRSPRLRTHVQLAAKRLGTHAELEQGRVGPQELDHFAALLDGYQHARRVELAELNRLLHVGIAEALRGFDQLGCTRAATQGDDALRERAEVCDARVDAALARRPVCTHAAGGASGRSVDQLPRDLRAKRLHHLSDLLANHSLSLP